MQITQIQLPIYISSLIQTILPYTVSYSDNYLCIRQTETLASQWIHFPESPTCALEVPLKLLSLIHFPNSPPLIDRYGTPSTELAQIKRFNADLSADACHIMCDGDQTEFCGGSRSFNLFSIVIIKNWWQNEWWNTMHTWWLQHLIYGNSAWIASCDLTLAVKCPIFCFPLL